MSAIHIGRHDEAAENRSKQASDAESTGAKLTDKRSSCNGGVFRAVYYTDALTRLDVVGQTGNFICKAGLFVPVTGSVGYLSNLLSLHLHNSNLSGELPSSLPLWLGTSFSNLSVLNLGSNNFHGDISPERCNLKYLRIFVLSRNKLPVEVPRCFSNFTAMAILENSSDSIAYMLAHGDWQFLENALLMSKGRQFEYSILLNLVVSLNVSRKQFSWKDTRGTNQPRLIAIVELVDESFGCQFQSFVRSSFIGNGICGPPLAPNCSESSAMPPGVEEDREGKLSGRFKM
ncbi:hypothetical protein FEM48_Zijuj03G0126700 [Ziziphus jujuba var. spinosa]|uniref:Uncharacterized protein n=1 Tax=Ziziphus jujuba var. spinosa TaxID=714518 RepID=A0A978VQD1_ZIZJJ|nr:hypothetical protein FEM48_Zijuj03G0126700 [Ziziphus jujuba var. spinosa]